MALRNWLMSASTNGQRRARKPHTCLGLLRLEGRDVPAVGFGTALGLGNDAGNSEAVDVATDATGNSYITGNFYGTVDFDPANTHPGNADILNSVFQSDSYVAKYAPDGALLWAVRMGGTGTSPGGDQGRAIDVDAAGNVYASGQFRGTGDYGAFTLTAAGSGRDGWVVKLNSAGTVLWANRWGRAETDSFEGEIPQGLDTDAAGNVYAISSRVGSPEGHDIVKFNNAGTQQWAKFIASNSALLSCDLATDGTGNVFVSGAFSGRVDFDPNQTTKWVTSGPGSYSGFVLKLTTAGKFSWVSPFVSQSQLVNGAWTYGYSGAGSLTLDAGGNVIVGGFYSNKVDFNPGNGTTNLPTGGGGFIAKLAPSNGALSWAKAIEEVPTESTYSSVSLYGLATDAAGNIYATGSFSGTADFDPGAGVATRTSAGDSDAFVLKLSSAGNFSWAEAFGGTGSDLGHGVAVDPTGTVHVVGYFSVTVDFDPDPLVNYDLTTPGIYSNAFLVRLWQN